MIPGWRWVALAGLAALVAAAVLLLPGPAAAPIALVALLATALLVRAADRAAPAPAPEPSPAPDAPPGAGPPPDATPLLAPLPCGILLLDDDLTVLAANDALARIVEHPLETMLDVSLIRAIREIELVEFARERLHGSREAHLTNGVEARLSSAPIDLPLPAGHATQLIAVEDVTALRAAQRARSDLVANLAHELRTPLAGARAIAETFQTAAGDPAERERFLRLLGEEIERMSRLVERMLLLAQLESGDEPIELKPLSPEELLGGAAARVAPVASQRKIRVDIEEATGRLVAGHRDHVGEVLANLLDNALRHSPDDSRIALAALAGSGEVRFEVRDEGSGILPSERERVFERFYTGDDARGTGGGAGLGLAITRQLVHRLGGRIWVADRLPGATVCFTLALARDSEPPSHGVGETDSGA
ncbi:MAG: hypothetical protein F4056_08825 [Chloroflexi bacterium]|nr:hypothetical protein [Chloroflexota bacterium]